MFDVGAYLGYYSLVDRAAGMDIFLFEPEPTYFDFLAKNAVALDAEDREDTEVREDAEDREDRFVFDPANPGQGHPAQDGSFIVQCKRLDGLDIDTSNLRFIKIDVEGNEIAAL